MEAARSRPNVVFILTDNQSPWTLGCYGNREILTPNIDGLAAGGLRFTNAFCTNPVCSPNRATLLTGLMPSQHGVHNWLGQERPDAQMGAQAYCTIGEFASLPQILADEGYDCALSGKWHLGDSAHPQLGFEYWFSKAVGGTSSFYGEEYIWRGEVYRESRYSLDAIADHACAFLRDRHENPFFLLVGFNGPYGLDQDMRSGHRNRHAQYYADKELECFPRLPMHPWLTQNRDCIMNDTVMRSYACAVSGVDDGVGAILETLSKTGLERDTLVVFTADHGLCGGHNGMWGMGDHSVPMHMFEENLRVPLIYRHLSEIPAGETNPTLVAHYDFLPSILGYLGIATPVRATRPLAGRSYADALRGGPLDWREEIVFHEYENTRAVQTPRWKLVMRHPTGPDEIYDLQSDPGERRNLTNGHAGADAREDLVARLRDFFERHADPEYDLWRGGRTKAGRMLDAE